MAKITTKKIVSLSLCILTLLLISCSLTGNPHPNLPPPDAKPSLARINNRPENPETKPFKGPLEIGVHDAVLMALENNRSLKVEKRKAEISSTLEEMERAAFDFVLSSKVSFSHKREKERFPDNTTDTLTGEVELSKLFPTGTRLSSELTWGRTLSGGEDRHSTRLGLTVTQALLKGYDVNANLVNIRKSELDVASSEYELRGFIESLVAQVESTYWDYVLSLKQLKILEESLALAEESRRQTAERISIGKLAETELAAAEAEVALRKQDLINAKASLSSIRLRLLRLLNPPASNLWEIQIIAKEEPSIPQVELDDVENHINVALKMRPEMNQAKLQVLKGELDVIKTKDGLLPKLDAFLSLGRSGYADSLWDSIRNFNERNHDFSGGLIFEFPLGNRAAKAQTKRALLSHEQSLLALQNLSQLIEVDIRSAYVEVSRSKEQVTASAATRKLQEEKLRAENEKFNVGKSTAFMVAQAQRDFVRSQVSEVEAVVKYLKALVDLYRLEGSLLERRGISAPGRTPVTLPLETTEEKK